MATKQKQVLLDARRANVYAADTGHEGAKRIVYVPTYFTRGRLRGEISELTKPCSHEQDYAEPMASEEEA